MVGNVGGESWGAWVLAALGALATVGAAYWTIRVMRHDRAADKGERLQQQVSDHDSRIAALEAAVQWIRTLFKQP